MGSDADTSPFRGALNVLAEPEDQEVDALSRAWGAIRHLDPERRIRVVQYLADRSRAEAECPFEFKTGRTA